MLIGNISFLHENVCNLSGTASSGLVLFDASKSPSRRPRLYSGARPGLPPTLSCTRRPPPLLAFAPAPGHLLPPPPAYHPTTLTNPDFSLLALCQQDSPGPSLVVLGLFSAAASCRMSAGACLASCRHLLCCSTLLPVRCPRLVARRTLARYLRQTLA